MKLILSRIVFALMVLCGIGSAQNTKAIDPCPMVHEDKGYSYGAAFQRFDGDLRSALSTQDITQLAFLVQFPLTVYTESGTILIPDTASLRGHMAMVFSPLTRKKILTSDATSYVCRFDGFGLADGTLWLEAVKGKYVITTVHVEEQENKKKVADKLLYTCETKTHRVSVEQLSNGSLHYQSWNKPRPITGVPDLDLKGGKDEVSGTGVCSHSTYTFSKGNVTIDVEPSIGCTEGPPPAKATGHLTVRIADKVVTDTYCF